MGNNYKGNETEIQILNKIKIPTILPHGLIKDRPYVNCPMLLTDIQTAFAEGIRHLISLGHHRIATIALQSSPLPKNIRDFEYTEYLDFLSQEGASPDSSLVCFTTCTYESIRNSIIGLLRSPFPPTAIMCYSDFFAIHVYKILNELNIKIPEDISVMGFCGYFGGQFMNPPLSTVDFMYEEIGRNALDLMLRSNEWFPYQKAPMTIFTPYRMLVRKSTMAANHFIYDAL